MTTNPTIAAKIRAALRKANADGYSYQQLAEMCNCSKQLIQLLMSDPDKTMNLSTAEDIAEGLGMRITIK